jgi:hypothetical protein
VTPTTLPPGEGFGARLVVRRAEGLAPGAYPVEGGEIGTPVPAPAGPGVSGEYGVSGDELVRLCMGQEHLRHAGAALVFHARRGALFDQGAAGVDQGLLRVGALAHLLCLGATGSGIAATAIGGFDGAGWGSLAGVPEDDEVLYVVMLGVSGSGTVKLDRLPPAYAHGEDR